MWHGSVAIAARPVAMTTLVAFTTLALSYRLDADAMLYANVSQGFRAPQTAELYQLQRAQQKAQLQEVQADNIEVGLKGATRDLRYQVALYRMVKDNLIFRDSDFFYINDGESSHEGVEVELNYRYRHSGNSILLLLCRTSL